jgi:hypothetical protein
MLFSFSMVCGSPSAVKNWSRIKSHRFTAPLGEFSRLLKGNPCSTGSFWQTILRVIFVFCRKKRNVAVQIKHGLRFSKRCRWMSVGNQKLIEKKIAQDTAMFFNDVLYSIQSWIILIHGTFWNNLIHDFYKKRQLLRSFLFLLLEAQSQWCTVSFFTVLVRHGAIAIEPFTLYSIRVNI